ncbi:MAG: hypothetical protein DBX45_08650 [Oscillospiraceae bacterium]|jgi:cof-like hydrolase|nr:MAG: hypothetical protein DBX45_08650 [Oscillospiraceae bacterium]
MELKYKLAASDMDGTLLDDGCNITDENLAAIRAAEAAGMIFTISTGRALCALERYLAVLDITAPIITYNGAMIVRPDGQILYSRSMSESAALRVWRDGVRADTTMILWSGNRLYSNKDNDIVRRYRIMSPAPYRLIGDGTGIIETLAHDGVTKILYCDMPERIEELRLAKADCADYGVTCFKSKPEYLENVDSGVSKGAALARLCELLDIPVSASVAFGDEANDIEMLRTAGLGVAMGNATDTVKSIADTVTLTNEQNGVGAMLRYLVGIGPAPCMTFYPNRSKR